MENTERTGCIYCSGKNVAEREELWGSTTPDKAGDPEIICWLQLSTDEDPSDNVIAISASSRSGEEHITIGISFCPVCGRELPMQTFEEFAQKVGLLI